MIKRKNIQYIVVAMLLFACALSTKAQYKVCYRASNVYMGIKGSLGCGFLGYPTLKDEKILPKVSWDVGLILEWRLLDKFSVGLDVLYSNRGYQLAFDTPYLVSYNQEAVTDIKYTMKILGFEACIPLTYYFNKPKVWQESYARMFVFVAPVFFLPVDGSISWKRTHLIDNQVITSNDLSLNSSNFASYEYGAKVGLGVLFKHRVGHYFYTARIDISYYHGISNSLSAKEMNKEALFYGLGDIEHEPLGERFLRQFKLSFSFAIPFRDKPKGACFGM